MNNIKNHSADWKKRKLIIKPFLFRFKNASLFSKSLYSINTLFLLVIPILIFLRLGDKDIWFVLGGYLFVFLFIIVATLPPKPKRDENGTWQPVKPLLNNFNENGYDFYGFNKKGFHKNTNSEFDEDGLNWLGYDINGFNIEGYNQSGFDRKGYDQSGFDRKGYDQSGFDRKGYNQSGFDRKGYDQSGFDRKGLNKLGETYAEQKLRVEKNEEERLRKRREEEINKERTITTAIKYPIEKVVRVSYSYEQGKKTGTFNIPGAIELMHWNAHTVTCRMDSNNRKLIWIVDAYQKTIKQYVEI